MKRVRIVRIGPDGKPVTEHYELGADGELKELAKPSNKAARKPETK